MQSLQTDQRPRARHRHRTMRAAGVLPPPRVAVLSAGVAAQSVLPSTMTVSGGHGAVPAFSHAIDLNLPGWRGVDQGRPGTCVALAVAACVAHLEHRADRPVPKFSEQFLYWAIKHESDDHDNFAYHTKLIYAAQALEKMGICESRLLPYGLRLVTDPRQTVSGPTPSAAAFAGACDHRHKARFYLDRASVDQPIPHAAETLLERLCLGRPVAICFPTFSRPGRHDPNNWDNQGLAAAYGIVADPMTSGYTEETGSHCVCVVGFDPRPPGGAKHRFIVRNSWGTADWGQHGGEPNAYPAIPQRGYGSMSVDYVDNYCWEMMQL